MFFLKSTYSLRKQLLLSFGSVSVITTMFVLVTAVIWLSLSCNKMRDEPSKIFKFQITENLVRNGRYITEAIQQFILNQEKISGLIHEIVQDRIVGYPNVSQGWEDDKHVPFPNMDNSGRSNKYPLRGEPLPLDWSINFNSSVNDSNKEENLQERSKLYDAFPNYRKITTASASYFMQGVCDPGELNVDSPVYYPNCTDANNNVSTGGVVRPTSTSKSLYDKAGDIALLLKPIYESFPDVMQLSVYFHNEGAGSVVNYPGSLFGQSSNPNSKETWLNYSYISEGCEWMINTTNPHTNMPIGTEREVANCHPKGTRVPLREYNANEFGWYALLVQSCLCSDSGSWVFPGYQTFGQTESLPVFIVGRSIYDSRTNHFIGIASAAITLSALHNLLSGYKMNENMELAVVDEGDGLTYSDSLNLSKNSTGNRIFDTEFISKDDFIKLNQTFPTLKATQHSDVDTYMRHIVYSEFYFYSAYPLFVEGQSRRTMVILRVSYNVFAPVEDINERILKKYISLIYIVLATVVIGLLVTFGIVWGVSGALTRPLSWMRAVASDIVNHNHNSCRNDTKYTMDEIDKVRRAKTAHVKNLSCEYLPKTEISYLVDEFQKMINGFSGPGVSRVAYDKLCEVRNKITWQSDFKKLYKNHTIGSKGELFFRLAEEKNNLVKIDINQSESMNDGDDKNHRWENPRSINCHEVLTSRLDEDIRMLQLSVRGNTQPEAVGRVTSEVGHDSCRSLSSLPRFQFSSICPAPPRLHFGSNIIQDVVDKVELQRKLKQSNVHPNKSLLFWSILFLIVMPITLTALTVWHMVGAPIDVVENWIKNLAAESADFEIDTLKSIAQSKSKNIYMFMNGVTSDLHFMTRLAGWLHFDAVNRSDSFTKLNVGSQECRRYSDPYNVSDGECPYFKQNRPFCACEWNDRHSMSCTKEGASTRSGQQRHMFGQRRDASKDAGDRLFVKSFGLPNVDDKPSHTLWWSNFSEMPGASSGSNVSGYATTYSRIRVSSAMSVVDIPLYNYRRYNRHFIGSMVAFDADGSGTGYRGCMFSYAYYSSFQSTVLNDASNIAPELCPLGKFGYDPRCRSWYERGKRLYNDSRIPLHVTAPYKFVSAGFVGMSATAPLVNPSTNEYIGQVLLDFLPPTDYAFGSLSRFISFIVAVDTSVIEDTVLGPDGTIPVSPVAIGDLLLPLDSNTSELRRKFERETLPVIKNTSGSGIGVVIFNRTAINDDSSHVTKQLTVAFHRVNIRGLLPVRPSDFTRGVHVQETPAFVVCIAFENEVLMEPWDEMIKRFFSTSSMTFNMIVLIAFIFFVICIFKITMIVTRAMLMLLKIVKQVNDGIIDNDIPPLHGGSREVHQVYASFAKLIKIVRMSNVSYFSGDLVWAYNFISDALQLFRKMDDEKAQGIACSNLANTLHAMCDNAVYSDDCCHMINGICCIKSALIHYNEAIEISERHVQDAMDSIMKAELAQQLSDRLFNRGLFLFLVYDQTCCPSDAKNRAMQDIARTKFLDDQVKEFFLSQNLLLKNSKDHFDRLIRRSFGLLRFAGDNDLMKVWNVQSLIEEADVFLSTAWDELSAPIFLDVTREGRWQQLESVVIQYELCHGRLLSAASVGLRMLVEDEFILDEPFKIAATAMSDFIRDDVSACWSNETKVNLKSDLRGMLRRRKVIDVDVGKCLVFAFEMDETWQNHPLLEKISTECLLLYDDCCFGDDFVGLVAYTATENLSLQLAPKSDNVGIQRSSIDIASASSSNRAGSTAPIALQMIIDSTVADQLDSFIVLVTDGSTFELGVVRTLKEQVQHINEDREIKTHIIIVGIEIQNDIFVQEYKSVCSVTQMSMYLDVSMLNIEAAFSKITKSIRGSSSNRSYIKGITMERF